jgi:hypothetical protein
MVQIAYWTGASWSFSPWTSPSGYSHGQAAIYGNCAT